MDKYFDLLKHQCKLQNVPVSLCMNLIYFESRFDSTAKNKKTGCQGYFQIDPINTNGKVLCPKDNIIKGIELLHQWKEEFGSWEQCLRFYVSGNHMYIKQSDLKFIME
jgi:hypothetical protein